MDADQRKVAQERVDRIRLFRRELVELEQEGALVLSPDQRSGLETHWQELLGRLSQQYGVDASDSAKRISWATRVAALLGGAALFAATVLFLHRIWGGTGTGVQVGILTVVPLLLLLGAEWTAQRRVDPFYPALLALVATISFATGLGVLGTVLNSAGSPQVLLVSAGFALLVAYALGVRLVLAGGLVTLVAYTAALWMVLQGRQWDAFMERSEYLLPAAIACYAWPWVLAERPGSDFSFIYRSCGAAVGLLALLVASFSSDPCCAGLGPTAARLLYQMAGLLVSAAVVAHGVQLGRVGLVNLGAAAFVVFLFVRLQAWFWAWMPKYLFFLLLGGVALALALVFRRLRRRLAVPTRRET